MTTLPLTDPTSGTTLDLIGAQSLTADRQGQVDVSPPPGSDSDQPFLTALEQSGEVTIQGAATGPRLARDPAYPSDPIPALAEWAATLLAFGNGAQGDGYELARDYRAGETFTGYISDLTVTRRGGEPLEAGYSISFVRGEGVGVTEPVNPPATSPGGDYTLDGEILPNITEVAHEKQQEVSVARRTFADSPDENDLFSEAGATRTVTVTGQVSGDATARKAFDDALTATIGQDTLVTYRDAFFGQTYEGFIESYEATDEAGRTRLGDYGLTFVEGTE